MDKNHYLSEFKKISTQLQQAKDELFIFYEISNAMRTTLKLEYILYIILTGVTAKSGLGFDRAFLFLIDKEKNSLTGKMAVGPQSGKESDKIWQKLITLEREDINELIKTYERLNRKINKGLTDLVKKISIPLLEDEGIPVLTALENMPHRVDIKKSSRKVNQEVLKILKLVDFVAVPLASRSKVQGVIIADNIISHKPITPEDVRILSLLATQAGLAIENSKHYEYVKEKANKDSLTNLYNHGRFQKLLSDEFERARRYKGNLSLLFIDVDFFKNYNDLMGHQTGDKILVEIANILRKNARTLDIVARYGGEEFAIILPHTKKQQALKLAERIRKAVERSNFDNQKMTPSGNLTISLGVSSYHANLSSKAELIEKADRALYIAKSKGRNRTESVD